VVAVVVHRTGEQVILAGQFRDLCGQALDFGGGIMAKASVRYIYMPVVFTSPFASIFWDSL
jgi:hypothetical protein